VQPGVDDPRRALVHDHRPSWCAAAAAHAGFLGRPGGHAQRLRPRAPEATKWSLRLGVGRRRHGRRVTMWCVRLRTSYLHADLICSGARRRDAYIGTSPLERSYQPSWSTRTAST
jgi:hypothetical protein